MRRSLSAILPTAALTLVASGCASTGTAPIESATATTQSTVRVDGGAAVYQAQLSHDDRATENDLTVSADRAFAILPAVYEEIGLKINTAISDSRVVGVNAARTRRIGKERLSRYLACGNDVTGNAIADAYAVTLTVLSRVSPSSPTGSLLSTQVIATATPMSVSGTTITCQSTGVLEALIAKTTTLRAVGAGAS